MRAIVTSIGESTTELCEWSLHRLGFRVQTIRSGTSLWGKLQTIFDIESLIGEDFLRVDADVIVNKNVLELIELKDLWWYQGLTFDWNKQDISHGGIQFIRSEAIPAIKRHINEARNMERPESYLSRLEEFHNPRRFGTFEKICGLHSYKQDDIERIKATKYRRGHYDDYDWELAERISVL